ncbi:hypothetical protein LMH87_012236 [Akanthomyces muscarius]|uniref:F-box domain-containing protein n=1 Tax=Akanthomyces muscarius TaxID=2231603 RepID=A0A9W8QAR4_AKAMU|nr:hypothetical protein LMH87_012236 [Akanthomyces muscarius]KAJ4151544.1 hypothetical protein LMH87_012236 [Akanthomyces muscarius]
MAPLANFSEPASTLPRQGDLHDYWPVLPSELVLHIFQSLSTVEQLWSLACSSSRLWKVFRANSTRILQRVLEDDTHPWLLNVIHATFNLHARDIRLRRYEEFRHLDFSLEAPESLSKTAPPEFVIRFVTKTRRFHAMAHVILENCMKDIWSIGDKLHPACPDGDGMELTLCIDRQASPSEETRAVMGLWLAELYYSLTDAYSDNEQPWVKMMIDSLPAENKPLLGFFRKTWAGPLLTITHGAQLMRLKGDAVQNRFPPTWGNVRLCIRSGKLPRGGLAGGLYCRTAPSQYSPQTLAGPSNMTEMCKAMRQRPLTRQYFHSIRTIAPQDDEIHHLPYRPFIRFGFFHWDHNLMERLGLFPSGQASRHDLFRYWKSFLSTVEVAELAREQAVSKNNYWQQVAELRARNPAALIGEPHDDADYVDVYENDVDTEDEEKEKD